MSYYPLVGLFLGIILAGVNYLLSQFFPSLVTVALVLTLWVLLTGALHLDGFLDACDGIFGGHTPEKRLEIMRDERVGAFALAGGVLLMLLKFTALNAQVNPTMALLLAPILSRWGMALAIVGFPYARAQGLGSDIKETATWQQALLATMIATVTAWFTAQWLGIIAMIITGLVIWLGSLFSLRRIPGLTGDIYGTLNEISETIVLLVLISGINL